VRLLLAKDLEEKKRQGHRLERQWGLALRIILEQREHTSRQQSIVAIAIVGVVVVVVDVDGSHFPMGCFDAYYIGQWMISNHRMHVELRTLARLSKPKPFDALSLSSSLSRSR
jgi:hypothetical protein